MNKDWKNIFGYYYSYFRYQPVELPYTPMVEFGKYAGQLCLDMTYLYWDSIWKNLINALL